MGSLNGIGNSPMRAAAALPLGTIVAWTAQSPLRSTSYSTVRLRHRAGAGREKSVVIKTVDNGLRALATAAIPFRTQALFPHAINSPLIAKAADLRSPSGFLPAQIRSRGCNLPGGAYPFAAAPSRRGAVIP